MLTKNFFRLKSNALENLSKKVSKTGMVPIVLITLWAFLVSYKYQGWNWAEKLDGQVAQLLEQSLLRPRAFAEKGNVGYRELPLSARLMKGLPKMTIGERIHAIIEERCFKNPDEAMKLANIKSGTFHAMIHRNTIPKKPANLYAISKALCVDGILIVKGVPWNKASANLKDPEKMYLLRLRRGWTQEDLVKRLEKQGLRFNVRDPDVKRNTVSQWERGVVPSYDKQGIIRRVLGDSTLFSTRRKPAQSPPKAKPLIRKSTGKIKSPQPATAVDIKDGEYENAKAQPPELTSSHVQESIQSIIQLLNAAIQNQDIREIRRVLSIIERQGLKDKKNLDAMTLKQLTDAMTLKQLTDVIEDAEAIIDKANTNIKAKSRKDEPAIRPAAASRLISEARPNSPRFLLSSILRPRAAGDRVKAPLNDYNKVQKAIFLKDPYFLSELLRERIKREDTDPVAVIDFFRISEKICEEVPEAPIEIRHPVLQAVALLEKDEQDKLASLLTQDGVLREKLIIVDSILLMLEDMIPLDWVKRHTPLLVGRRVWDVSAEGVVAAGGLGRVQQFKNIPMSRALKYGGGELCMIEPDYRFRLDGDGQQVPINDEYLASLPMGIHNIRQYDEFTIKVHRKDVKVVCRVGETEEGLLDYRISDPEGYYTAVPYNYETEQNRCTWYQFSEFLSRAAIELICRVETRDLEKKKTEGQTWKPPIIHLEDSHAGLAAVLRRIRVLESQGLSLTINNIMRERFTLDRTNPDYVLAMAIDFFTTHTNTNRQEMPMESFLNILYRWAIPRELSTLGEHRNEEWKDVGDVASMALRVSNGRQCVSWQQLKEVAEFDRWWLDDKWGIPFRFTAVTNGELRALTSRGFKQIMNQLFEDADYENPIWQQCLEIRKKAKIGLGLNPEQPVVIYIGRFVLEKAGRMRALNDSNIRRLVEMGFQVVFLVNVQRTGDSVPMKFELDGLVSTFQREQVGPGRLVFIPHFDQTLQEKYTAAANILVVDSDPKTEAAGLTEIGFSGVVIAPPWPAGILQAGPRMDLDKVGKGNTIVPQIDIYPSKYSGLQKYHHYDMQLCEEVAAAYMRLYEFIFEKLSGPERSMRTFLENLARYDVTAIRAGRALEARLTVAEQLRQYNTIIASLEESSHPPPAAPQPAPSGQISYDEVMSAI